MKILIWKKYGNTNVFDISSCEKFKNVLISAIEIIEFWGIEGAFPPPLMRSHLEKYSDNWEKMKVVYTTLCNIVDPGEQTEDFEIFTIGELIQ